MIVLFTDFGLHGPYTGQVKAVLHQMAPDVPAIDLFADAPVGVGGTRPAIVLEADSRWYVGPGNGLFELVQRRATTSRSWDVFKPKHLSASFHGRGSCHAGARRAPTTSVRSFTSTISAMP